MGKLAITGGDRIVKDAFPVYPSYGAGEAEALKRVIDNNILSSTAIGGREVKEFENEFAKFNGSKFAIAVSNGTTALHVALAALGIGAGDEVIVPPYTFLATAVSVLMQNAIPVFSDIEPETLGLDPAKLEEKITSCTKAIIVVHINGYPCDMEGIMKVAKKHKLFVVEDCAQAQGAVYKGKNAGSMGDVGTFSFQHKKNLSMGEGGMVVTNDEDTMLKARSKRGFGDIVPLSCNYRMTEMQGAIGKVRLEKLPAENERRRENAKILDRYLDGMPGIKSIKQRENTKSAFYNYEIWFNYEEAGIDKDTMIKAWQAEGIPAGFIYYPLYRDPNFSGLDIFGNGCPYTCPYHKGGHDVKGLYQEGSCKLSEEYCDKRGIDIKIHPPAGEKEMMMVVNAYKKILDNIDELKDLKD